MSELTVEQLLAQSKSHHMAAHPPRGQKYHLESAVPHWREALRLRMEAHRLDPTHESDAWRQGPNGPNGRQDQHAAILSFYARYGVTE